MSRAALYVGDALDVLRTLPDESVQCCVTSPPYWGLRDYGVEGQLGLEPTPFLYVEDMVAVFQEVRRVLRNDGTLWLNLGDSYNSIGHKKSSSGYGTTGLAGGHAQEHHPLRRENSAPGLKHKDLVMIPARVAMALQADGWWLRSDTIWSKPNPMPESVQDRPTRSHEYVFLLSKSQRYFYDADAIAEPLTTDTAERYPERARITGRGTQGAAAVRGNDRDKSGGFPPRRPQRKRAEAIARNAGLTQEHLDAIRAVGITDVGKARITQSGYGKNDRAVQVLADEAKAVLGGYYREFLSGSLRNARSVWTIATKPYTGAHYAVMPLELASRCIKAGSKPTDTVLDPFGGSGTTARAATDLGRNAIHIDLNPDLSLAIERIGPLLVDVKEDGPGRTAPQPDVFDKEAI